MTELRPVPYQWDGDHMVPLPRFKGICDKQNVVGEIYTLVEADQERSMRSHAHYFAQLGEYYKNLHEALDKQFPTFEHFRKRLLISAGYYDERSIVCSSAEQAESIAAFVRPIDDYAVVLVSFDVVTVFTAKSQRRKAMGAKDFQDSKDAVLSLAADIVGVDRETMRQNVGRAA